MDQPVNGSRRGAMSALAAASPAGTGADLLPGADDDGFFGIRFESIGGLGAHLAGQILAEAGVLRQGLNGAHFSSYGSEKKGTPVKSFVRFCATDREVRTSSPIESPQVVAVFHEALARSFDVAAGLSATGTLIVNTRSTPEEIQAALGLRSGTVAVLDALGIALEEKTRVNTAMLGAVARSCPFVDPDVVKETLRQTLSVRYAHLVEANLRTFDRGYRELRRVTWPPAPDGPGRPVQRAAPAFGYLDAPIGGVILDSGNSVVKNLSTSRQGFLPAYDPDSCVHCGICDIVCPDLCFVWSDDGEGEPAVRLHGIDYHYCKGCLKCTDACPTGSLTALRDAARPRDPRRERAAEHPRRPLRRLLRAEHRLANLNGARPAGRLRPEPDRAARRRARRRAAARDHGLRRLLHQPPEAPGLELRRRRHRAGLARPRAGDGDGARPAAPGDDRGVHERPRPDQQQVPARAGDGRRGGRAPRGLRRVRGVERPALRPRRPVPDGRRRGRGLPAQLGRGDREGRGRPAAHRGRPRRRRQPQRDPPVSRGRDPRGAARRAGRRARRALLLLRRARRQPLARGEVRAPG